MMRKLPSDALSIGQVLSAPFTFDVPAFQRPYAWTTKEAGQLLDDVCLAAGLSPDLEPSEEYLFGYVVLIEPEQPDGRFGIVDGQQRVATLSMLVAALRHFELKKNTDVSRARAERLSRHILVETPDGLIPRLMLRQDDASFLNTRVFQTAAVDLAGCDTAGDTLPGVMNHLLTELEYLSEDERRVLTDFLLDRCHIVVFVAKNIDQAFRWFTVLNDRGKPLQPNDILKAEVLRSLSGQAATDALAIWDRADAQLGPRELEAFFSHLKAIYAPGANRTITAARQLVLKHGATGFLTELFAPLTALQARLRDIHAPQLDARPRLKSALVALNRHGRSDWMPPAMLALSRLETAPDDCENILVELERLIMLTTIFAGKSPRHHFRRLSALTAGLKNGEPFENLKQHFVFTRDETKTIAFHLRDLYGRNPTITKLLLMRIEDELAGRPLLLAPSALSVEHVLPKRPSATSDWVRDIPSPDHRALLVNSLGNFGLINSADNERARNRNLSVKQIIFAETSTEVDLELNQDIFHAKNWPAATIIAREARLLAVLESLWRIDLTGSRAEFDEAPVSQPS